MIKALVLNLPAAARLAYACGRKPGVLLALLLALVPCAGLAQYENVFEQNKIVYDKFDWKTYRSTHFTIYFYDRERDSLQKVASYAESAYDDISRQLNFQIPKPINLIYYATHSEFEQTNTLLNFIPEGIGAFALPSRNRMVLPVDLPDEKLQQLIAHELTHVFQFEILFGGNYLRAATTNAPQWLLEGMASYFGNDEDNKDRMVLRDAVLSDQVPEIAEKGISGFFAYRFGHAVFDFIAAEWGKDAVREFLFEFRNQISASIDKSLHRAFNISAEDFDIRFRRYLRQRFLKILTEKGEPIDFGERFKIEDTPSAELSPRAYPSGDFVAAFSTYKEDADVVVLSTRDRKLYRNLTKGHTTSYEYLISQWVTTGPQIGADLAVSPDGNTVAVFARRERGRDMLLLNALDGGIRERVEMPGIDQQLSPAFSPDGKLVVFRGMREGQGRHLFLRPLHPHHREPDPGRRVLGFRPGVLPGRKMDLLLVRPGRHQGQDPSHAHRLPGNARAGHLWRLERRGSLAVPRRQAAFLHLRPRPGASTRSTPSTWRRARRSCTPTSWPESFLRPFSSAATTRRSSSSRRTTSAASRSISPTPTTRSGGWRS